MDQGNKRVQVFAARCRFAGTIRSELLRFSFDVAVSRIGMVYVTDNGNNRVLRFEAI